MVGLDNKIKYRDILLQNTCENIVGMTVGAFTISLIINE